MPAGEPAALRALLVQRATPGRLVGIYVRPARGAAPCALTTAELIEQRGVSGDYASERSGGRRQVSLLQAEHLPVIAALVGQREVAPELLRRNLVVAGISVLALRAVRFRIGDAVLEGAGTCDPCSKMEQNLGVGGYNAVRGHGGIVARVISGGSIALGAVVDFVLPA